MADTLIVFGNIGFITNVRDAGINSDPGAGTSSGQGLTTKRLQYSIENQFHNIQVPEKYDIHFDRGKFDERKDIAQVFDLTFDDVHLNYGNNDFVELHSGDDIYLSPYPHTPIDGVQSNGIWFTKANADTDHVFVQKLGDKIQEWELLTVKLKATKIKVGLLINFGSHGKLEWKRFIRTEEE